MKNLKLFLVALTAVLMNLTAEAQNKNETTLDIHEYPNSDLAIVSILNKEAKDYRLQLQDVDGNALNKVIKISGKEVSVQKLLKFDHLSDGTYVMSLRSKDQNLKKYFQVKDNRISEQPLVRGAEDIKTYAFKEEDKLFITRIDFDGEEAEVKITNKKGEVFFNYDLPLEERYNGVFDISALPMGRYCVTISSLQSQYSYDFRK